MNKLAIISLIFLITVTNSFSKGVDIKKSTFNWKATKVTGEHVGTLRLKSGDLNFSNNKLTGGNLTMDINSVNVTDLSGKWKKKFLNHMKSADFFNVEKFPVAKLEILKVLKNKIKANLTIMGKTHEQLISFKSSKKSFFGEFTFDRTKFGMIYGSGDFFKNLGDKMIHNKILVKFKVVLK